MFMFVSTVSHPDRVRTVGKSDIMFMFASTVSHLDRVLTVGRSDIMLMFGFYCVIPR